MTPPAKLTPPKSINNRSIDQEQSI